MIVKPTRKSCFANQESSKRKKSDSCSAINELTEEQIQENDIEKVYAIVPHFASAEESLRIRIIITNFMRSY